MPGCHGDGDQGGDGNGGDGGTDDDGEPPRSPVSAGLRERLNRRIRPPVFGGRFDQLATAASLAARSADPVEPLDMIAGLVGVASPDQDGFFGSGDGRSQRVLETLLLSTLGTPLVRGVAASPALENFAFDLGGGRGSVLGQAPAAGQDDIAVLREEVASLRAEMAAMRRDRDG